MILSPFTFPPYLYAMKEYFIRLFEYDRYANQIILDTIIKANTPRKTGKIYGSFAGSTTSMA